MSTPLFEIVDWVETSLGLLCLRRRELLGSPGTVITEVTLDHELLMSSHHTASEEGLATRAIAWHGGSSLAVLVGGLGLGYTAAAALDCQEVARVRVVEYLPAVIGWLREGRVPLAGQLGAESRLEVAEGDVYAELLGPASAEWDLVLLDVDHSPSEPLGPSSAAFTTADGLRRVARHLAPGGVLAVWSADDDEAFVGLLEQVFTPVTRERISWVNDLLDDGEPVEDTVFLARKPVRAE